ncbi:hypothetical protein RSAG8_02750, partial [Rhizoctonia solani AG-8 WAC10335]
MNSILRTSSRAACTRPTAPRNPQYPRFFSRNQVNYAPPPNRPNPRDVYKARNRTLLMYTTATVITGVGATYAAVPLYRAFCSATGFGGIPMTDRDSSRYSAERLVPREEAKRIKVHFNADTATALPWQFQPQQRYVNVLPGETSLAFYKAKNSSKEDIIGILEKVMGTVSGKPTRSRILFHFECKYGWRAHRPFKRAPEYISRDNSTSTLSGGL